MVVARFEIDGLLDTGPHVTIREYCVKCGQLISETRLDIREINDLAIDQSALANGAKMDEHNRRCDTRRPVG